METMERREALADAKTLDAVEAVAAAAAEGAADCVDALSAAFAAGDVDGACRLILRLKYLLKLGEETRGRRAVLAQG
jgi:hypothetical protein